MPEQTGGQTSSDPRRPGLLTVGEVMARLGLPEHGRPSGAQTPLSVRLCGAEGNVAVAAARAGTPSAWWGLVGDDDLGSLLLGELAWAGVGVRGRRDGRGPTGILLAEHRRGRTSQVRYYRAGSAFARVEPADVQAALPALLAEAGVLHLTGLTPALGEGPAATAAQALELAHEAGTLVSLDVNYRSRLWSPEQAQASLRGLAASADVVFAGVEEALLLTRGSLDIPAGDAFEVGEVAAAELAALGPAHVVVKLGAHGALCLRDGAVTTAEAVPVQVVDTVGAGDAFVGGYLASWLQGGSTAQTLGLGARLGALACSALGDWEGVLDHDPHAAPQAGLAALTPGADPVR